LVNDKDYKIVVGKEAVKEVKTEKLNYVLDSLIISSNKPCEIDIQFAEISSVHIYTVRNHSGNKYIVIRKECINDKDERFVQSYDKWLLNNRLLITVRGVEGTVVDLTLRCE